MTEGLKIVTVPGGYYPYILVGWLVRIFGDEYRMLGARCIRRFGNRRQLVQLAKHGPYEDTELLDAAEEGEEVHRLQIGRSILCNEKAWKEACPKPTAELIAAVKRAG